MTWTKSNSVTEQQHRESPWYILMMTSKVFFHSPVEFLMNVLRPLLVLHSAKLSHIRVCGPEPQSVQAGLSLVCFPDVLPVLSNPAVGGSALVLLFPCSWDHTLDGFLKIMPFIFMACVSLVYTSTAWAVSLSYLVWPLSWSCLSWVLSTPQLTLVPSMWAPLILASSFLLHRGASSACILGPIWF